jgi:RHS repeat-associated protein
VLDPSSTIENNLRFPGQYYDHETGLHYNFHRYYDPTTGRYLIPDPIGLGGELSSYGYTRNSPLKFIDVLGLWSKPIHDRIIDHCFGALRKDLLEALKQGSDHVDTEYQAPCFSYMHAMRDGTTGQSVEAASRLMTAFIQDKSKAYKKMQCDESKLHEAYFALGEAMHALMDETNPLHSGFQPWYGTLRPRAYYHWRRERPDLLTHDILETNCTRLKRFYINLR